jgi:hypothetical protein
MRVVVVVAVLLAAGVGLVVSAEPAVACSCAGLSDEEAFAAADDVFVGTVASVPTFPSEGPWSTADPAEWVFDVESVYKGTVTARQSVWTPLSGASCGLELPAGNATVVVFATDEDDGLTRGDPPADDPMYASLCGGSRALAAASIPASFGEPRPPLATDAARAPTETVASVALDDERDPWVLWGAAALALAVVGIAVALLVHQRRRPT